MATIFDRFCAQWRRVGLPGKPRRINASVALVSAQAWGVAVAYDAKAVADILRRWPDGYAKTEAGELTICEHFGATGAALETVNLMAPAGHYARFVKARRE